MKMENPRRITVYPSGVEKEGLLVSVPLTITLPDLLRKIEKCIGTSTRVNGLYTKSGAKVCDVDAIRDEDIFYLQSTRSSSKTAEQASRGTELVPRTMDKLENPLKLSLSSLKISQSSDWLNLNVGGKHFMTTRSTLVDKVPESMLARMFSCGEGHAWHSKVDEHGAYLIDRSPRYFEPILNYLRHGQLVIDKSINPQGVLEEAKFFGIVPLVEQLEALVMDEQPYSDQTPISRREFVFKLMGTETGRELRCQGMNFTGANLSKLDLRLINFKYALLRGADLNGANLSFCNFERADLSHATLDGANLLGVKMLCVNLEGASMCVSNFEDPAGSRANMEGANMKHVNLEGSQMSGVNLRVATLKNANLQNCDLRGAVLAGADLENCNLSGCDLQEANLRGANLKGAAFELMLNPLHMAQTVR